MTQRPRAHWIIWVFAVVGLVGVLAVVVLCFVALDFDRPYRPARVAGEKKEAVFTVSAPQQLAGTQLLAMNVSLSEPGLSSGSYSSGRGDQRNIVLIDKMTGASRKLLPDNNRTIDRTHFLPAAASTATDDSDSSEALLDGRGDQHRAAPPAYYLLVLRHAEQTEVKDVLVGSLEGAHQGIVMRGIDGLETVWMQNPTQAAMIVRDHLKLYYRIVDIPTLKVVLSRPVAID